MRFSLWQERVQLLASRGCLFFIFFLAVNFLHPAHAQQQDWPVFGGSPEQSRYVNFDQINKNNVDQLRIEWMYPVAEQNVYQFSPIVVGDIMYVLAKDYSLVAINAVTGKELWSQAGFNGIARRGILYWEGDSGQGSDKRLLVTKNNELHAIDANTGKPINSFGVDGKVDLRVGLGRDPETVRRVQAASPGAIFDDLILLGSSPGESYFSTPGHLRAYNIVSGKLEWTFHTIPQPGEFGYDTWPKDAWKYAGGVNAWGEITIDTKNGIAFFPLGSPTYDYYGADRHGANLFGNSLLALDARSGKRLWHFQTVHHGLWDYDLAAAPQLLTVNHNGKKIDAVAQASKQGFLFVFDRVTGKPLWPIEEREVPASTMPGEQAWPTQPFPTQLPITARQNMSADDLSNVFLSEGDRQSWIARISAAKTGLYQPISETETIAVPGGVGGTNWGNTAANPDKGILYVLNQDFPSFYRLEAIEPDTDAFPSANNSQFSAAQIRRGANEYKLYCQVCHGADRSGGPNGPSLLGLVNNISHPELNRIISSGQGRMPAMQHVDDATVTNLLAYLSGGTALPYPVGANYPEGVAAPKVQYRTDYGLSHPHIMQPPWSTIMAIDLNAGKMLWKKPLGQDREASAAGFENTGVPRGTQRNGMIVTSTGLIFSTAKDGKIYAFDADNGEVLWTGELPMGTEGLPAMYVIDGKQYLVVNATTPLTWGPESRESGIGSTKAMGKGGYVVFALPGSK